MNVNGFAARVDTVEVCVGETISVFCRACGCVGVDALFVNISVDEIETEMLVPEGVSVERAILTFRTTNEVFVEVDIEELLDQGLHLGYNFPESTEQVGEREVGAADRALRHEKRFRSGVKMQLGSGAEM